MMLYRDGTPSFFTESGAAIPPRNSTGVMGCLYGPPPTTGAHVKTGRGTFHGPPRSDRTRIENEDKNVNAAAVAARIV